MKIVPGLLLLLGLTAGPSISLAELCSHEVLIRNANFNVSIPLSRTPSDLYVRPDPGFQGVSLEVGTSNGKNYSAFFPKQDECFQDEADWWQIQVATGNYTYTSDDVSHRGLYIRMRTARCQSLCYYIATVDEIERFVIMGHGDSAWRRSAPDPSCKTVKITGISGNKAVPCKPYTSQNTDTTTTTTPAATKGLATTAPPNTIPNPTMAPRPTTPTPETTASPTTPNCTGSTLSVLVAVVVVLVVVLAVVVVEAVRLALRVKALKEQLTAQRPALHQVSSGGAGGAVLFSSLQDDSRLMGHNRDYRSPLYPSLGTLKVMPQ